LTADVARLAREALDGLDGATTRASPSDRGPFTVADGYDVARDVDEALRARGWKPVGRKLAFTDRSTWSKLAVDRPGWGYVYDRTLHDAGTPFSLAGRVAPRLETELVVRLARVPESGEGPGDVAACLEWAALGFEVIDCHYPGWRFAAADALADVVLHAGLIVGARTSFGSTSSAVEWAKDLPTASVTVHRDGAPDVTGSAAAVLGDPLAAIGALVVLLQEQRAEPLHAGEIITTGTMTTPFDIRPGEIRAEMRGPSLPPIRVTFSG